MSIHHYETSENLPAMVAYVGEEKDVQSEVRFESQSWGFGMVWTTSLNFLEAFKIGLPILGEPQVDDSAEIVRYVIHDRYKYGTNEEKEVPLPELDTELAINPEEIQIVTAEIGEASLVWARASGEGNSPTKVECDESRSTRALREMSFGAEYYRRLTIEKLLTKTGTAECQAELVHILDAADVVLQAHIPGPVS
jgi:hypothetical protein